MTKHHVGSVGENHQHVKAKYIDAIGIAVVGTLTTGIYLLCAISGMETIHLGNMNLLEIVDLSDHTSLSIHHETFKSLPSLRRLVLKNCSLEKFPALSSSSADTVLAGSIPRLPASGYCNASSGVSTLQWYNPKLQEIDFSDNPELFIMPGEATFPPSLLQLRLGNITIPMIEHDFLQYSPQVGLRSEIRVGVFPWLQVCHYRRWWYHVENRIDDRGSHGDFTELSRLMPLLSRPAPFAWLGTGTGHRCLEAEDFEDSNPVLSNTRDINYRNPNPRL